MKTYRQQKRREREAKERKKETGKTLVQTISIPRLAGGILNLLRVHYLDFAVATTLSAEAELTFELKLPRWSCYNLALCINVNSSLHLKADRKKPPSY